MKEFTFCNIDQVEIMVQLNCTTGRIIHMYCYADHLPTFENPETSKELKTTFKLHIINPLFTTIVNKSTTLRRMVIDGNYLPLLDNEESDYNESIDLLVKCFELYHINWHSNIFQ